MWAYDRRGPSGSSRRSEEPSGGTERFAHLAQLPLAELFAAVTPAQVEIDQSLGRRAGGPALAPHALSESQRCQTGRDREPRLRASGAELQVDRGRGRNPEAHRTCPCPREPAEERKGEQRRGAPPGARVAGSSGGLDLLDLPLVEEA